MKLLLVKSKSKWQFAPHLQQGIFESLFPALRKQQPISNLNNNDLKTPQAPSFHCASQLLRFLEMKGKTLHQQTDWDSQPSLLVRCTCTCGHVSFQGPGDYTLFYVLLVSIQEFRPATKTHKNDPKRERPGGWSLVDIPPQIGAYQEKGGFAVFSTVSLSEGQLLNISKGHSEL